MNASKKVAMDSEADAHYYGVISFFSRMASMGKYIFYFFLAIIITFAANYFGIVSIPWLDVSFEEETAVMTHHMDETNQTIQKALEDSQAPPASKK